MRESAAHESSSKRGMPAFSAKVLALGVGKWGPRGGHVTFALQPTNMPCCGVWKFNKIRGGLCIGIYANHGIRR